MLELSTFPMDGGWKLIDFISVSQMIIASPEVEENKDSDKEGDDGHSVAKEEDEDLPLLDSSSLHVQGMVQAVGVVCVVVPGSAA